MSLYDAINCVVVDISKPFIPRPLYLFFILKKCKLLYGGGDQAFYYGRFLNGKVGIMAPRKSDTTNI